MAHYVAINMAGVHVSVRAYCKILLHAVKYPHCSINGLLLSEKSKNRDVKNINIVDTVPLFHICLGLTPMLEVALMQIDHYCKSMDLIICGYYQANEHYRDSQPDVFAFRIADKILENFEDACLFMVDNHKIRIDCQDIALNLYQNNDGKWKLKEKNCVHLEQDGKTLAAASCMLEQKAYRELVDFDNHLDDVSLSWENTHLNDAIKHLL